MNRTDYKVVLDKITQDVKSITDEKVQSIFSLLLNLVEVLISDNEQLRAENQNLRDENNRLKGEQGTPKIRKQTQPNKNISSEKERKKKNKKNKKNKKSKKKNKISTDRVEFCCIDKEQLPADAIFKGHKSVIVQDVVIKTANIEFKKEMFYSPSLKKTFLAPLPAGYTGEFGPNIKALVISLYHDLKMTGSNIHKLFKNHGAHISIGSISTKTGYDQLDERIKKTKARKDQLLLVLSCPFLPLHNNDSELCARDQARRRDISFHTMSDVGTESKDTFMTIAQTARKLLVNFYHFIFDRISKKYEMPSLADLIIQRAAQLV